MAPSTKAGKEEEDGMEYMDQKVHIDGLVQKRRNSSALLAMELRLFALTHSHGLPSFFAFLPLFHFFPVSSCCWIFMM